MSAYKIVDVPDTEQTPRDLSFKGGVPNIPPALDLPHCALCKAEMTFFFQIAFPQDHVWEGRVMAVFHCTSCVNVNNYWPKLVFAEEHLMLEDDVLDTYQTNFRIFVFGAREAVSLRNEAKRVLKFEGIEFEKIAPAAKARKVGGTPNWSKHRWSGTSPSELYKQITYMGGGVVFLMQTENDWTFTRLPEAPPQFEHYTVDQPRFNRYVLFNGPHLYFSGTTSSEVSPPRVLLYAL